jgi:hypothetical protein
MSSRDNRSWNSNRSFNRSLANSSRRWNRDGNRWNRDNDRWNRWNRWNRRYPSRYWRYPYYNYNPYFPNTLDYYPGALPLANAAPVRWFYRYPYYYYFYGYPFNRWYRVYQPINGPAVYTVPNATNLVAVDNADDVALNATVYTVPEGFNGTTTTVVTEGPAVGSNIGEVKDYDFRDYVTYDNLLRSNNSTYFMWGVFLLILILILVILFS